jgi:hypothetical protein
MEREVSMPDLGEVLKTASALPSL